jgi:hypothetical protein
MRFHAIPAEALDQVRTGTSGELFIASGGEPLRCCLRDAEAGERIMLFNYEPPLPASPYRELGPVFAHADACDAGRDDRRYPDDWWSRPQVLRAYDANGRIHPATRVHDGSDPMSALTEAFAEPGVVQIHSRNIAYGCYMFTVTSDMPV